MLHVQPTQKKKVNNKKTGDLGEEIATKYLKSKGFVVLDRNYLKKWGEIDIVTRATSGRVHFVEVKTVSYETRIELENAVTRRTWRPEENVHPLKLKRLQRAIESWLIQHKYDGEWQIDVVAIRIVPREKYATVKYLPNVIL
jgi:putative endonuclease